MWLRWSIDDFVDALPVAGEHHAGIIDFGSDGASELGSGFRRAETARIAGIAAGQAIAVHEGVNYDVEVDTTGGSSMECAHVIVAAMNR